MVKHLEDFLQPSGYTTGPGDTLKLVLQSLRRQGGLPDRFECDGLFQVSPDFTHQEFMGDRLLERLRGSYLMRVIDALDRLLRLDAVFEGEIAGHDPALGGKQKASVQKCC